MAYWWDGQPGERYWVEIRKIPGHGLYLAAPQVQRTGKRDGRYDLLDTLQVGDVVYHWDANQHRFVGRSLVALGNATGGSPVDGARGAPSWRSAVPS
jgi:hypothetical protein